MPAYKDKQRGTWYVKFSALDSVTGERKQKLKRGFATKREAVLWESEQRLQGGKTSLTCKQLSDKYYEFRKQKPRTIENQRAMLEAHFPYYAMPIGDITRPMLIKWHSEIDLSPSSANLLITVVKSIFKFGSDNYGLPNPATCLTRIKAKKRKYETWTAEEFSRFISAVDHPMYKALFCVYYFTGCRRNEALTLTKGDLKDGHLHIHGTKTESSDRVLKIPDALTAILEPVAQRLENDGELLFPVPETTVYCRFKAYMERSGVKRIRLHDLRHSFATSMIGSGANIVAVSRYLGHSTVQQTLATYSHMFEKADDELVEMIENGIKNVSDSL